MDLNQLRIEITDLIEDRGGTVLYDGQQSELEHEIDFTFNGESLQLTIQRDE